eukprot:412094_1
MAYDLIQVSGAGTKDVNGLYYFQFDDYETNCNGVLKHCDDHDPDWADPEVFVYYEILVNDGTISKIFSQFEDSYEDDGHVADDQILYERKDKADYDSSWIVVGGTEPAPTVHIIPGGVNPNYDECTPRFQDIYEQLLSFLHEKYMARLILQCCYGGCYHDLLSILFVEQDGKYGNDGRLILICEKCDKKWKQSQMADAVKSFEIDLKHISINYGLENNGRKSRHTPWFHSIPIKKYYWNKFNGNNRVIDLSHTVHDYIDVYDTYKTNKKCIGTLKNGEACCVLISLCKYNGMRQIIKPIKGWINKRVDNAEVLQRLLLNGQDLELFKSTNTDNKVKDRDFHRMDIFQGKFNHK